VCERKAVFANVFACVHLHRNAFKLVFHNTRRDKGNNEADDQRYDYKSAQGKFELVLDSRRKRIESAVIIAARKLIDKILRKGGSLGKTPLAPKISPRKTVEGAVFSLIGSTLTGLGLYYVQGLWTPEKGMGLFALLSLGFICGVAGQFGDLFASCLKRSVDMKDFSETLPGHGGFLDRLDSVLLCAPVVLAFCILALS
jgi:hypothetical protein